ncbi:MAG: coenzyme A pyrophosphatase [Bacteroidetes bacterium]|nr:MAG: coenzyme A pyrophosphatase [Bacteroidota bacterium]
MNQLEKIKQCLQTPLLGLDAQLLMAPEFRKEEILKRDSKQRPKRSAVLLLLNPFSESLSIILTKRSSALKVHRGQVSLPGGRVDDHDENAIATALRETEEEIGISPDKIEVIGQLSNLFIPPTHFDVCPIVGVLKEKPIYKINPDEVEEVVEVPLSQLLDIENIKRKVFHTSTSGINRTAPYYNVMGLEVWGATAMILSEFVELIKSDYL